ncbi:MAG: CoA transferase [Steroidobacteraceae bacterium]
MPALSGIRVIDFGHYAAGPLAAWLLAQQGAEVVHVDRPGPLSLTAEQDRFLQSGKQRRRIDLKTPAGQAEALELIGTADVLIENFRPGVMQRLGLGQNTLRARFPQLIYCSLPGFSGNDPRAGLAAFEGIVSAAAGLYSSNSPAGALPAEVSPYNALPLATNFAAFQAATAIVMALIARRRDGVGQWIEAPLFDAAVELLGPALPESFPNYTIIYGGGIYACAEGHVFLNANNPRFLFWLLDAWGVGGIWRADGLLANEVINGRDAVRNAELRRRMAQIFATETALHWQEFAARHHIPLARIASLQDWQHSAAARGSGAVVEVKDAQGHCVLQPGAPVQVLARAPATAQESRGPAMAAEAAGASGAVRGALSGVRVLDLANILAGPSVGRWLADFGAEVIKLNDPNALSVAMHDYLNRGKKSALVDVKRPQGRELVLRLAEVSDVFLCNFPQPTAQRYGLQEEEVRAARGDVIYASISCYGAQGPWAQRRGYEPQAQSCAGIMARYGGQGAPVMLPYLVNDYGTGILGAFAVGLALFARGAEGAGQCALASLAHTATLHQWTEFTQRWNRRLYRVADGWLFVAAKQEQRDALLRLLDVDCAASADDAVLTAVIDAGLRRAAAQSWVLRFAAAGIAVMPLATQRAAMQHPYAQEHGVALPARKCLSNTLEHPGITVHLSATPKIHGAMPQAVGTDLDAVLAIAGAADEASQWLAEGVISHQLAKPAIAPAGK